MLDIILYTTTIVRILNHYVENMWTTEKEKVFFDIGTYSAQFFPLSLRIKARRIISKSRRTKIATFVPLLTFTGINYPFTNFTLSPYIFYQKSFVYGLSFNLFRNGNFGINPKKFKTRALLILLSNLQLSIPSFLPGKKRKPTCCILNIWKFPCITDIMKFYWVIRSSIFPIDFCSTWEINAQYSFNRIVTLSF